MGRELNERDLQILKKLVPEQEELQNRGVDIEYMNILPPVANPILEASRISSSD